MSTDICDHIVRVAPIIFEGLKFRRRCKYTCDFKACKRKRTRFHKIQEFAGKRSFVLTSVGSSEGFSCLNIK